MPQMVNGLLGRATRVRRGLAVTGLALTTVLSGVVLTPPATAAETYVFSAGVVADVHVITYQGNGGMGESPKTQRVVDGGSATVAANSFVRDDYDFLEWNTRSDLKGTAYRPGASITPDGDTTLYARWVTHVEVYLFTSDGAQVYRTTDPQMIGVVVWTGGAGFGWAGTGDDDDDLPSPGTIEIRNNGVLMGSLPADPYGFTELPIPATLPLGRTVFTATFIPRATAEPAVTSDPVGFSVVRATTATRVTLRQQALSAADQKKFKVRSGVRVSVQVGSEGTRTAAPGKVAINLGGKVVTLALANGRATSALIPTSAGSKTVTATYQPGNDLWVRSTGRASITIR